jgi:L-fuconate dehydratase
MKNGRYMPPVLPGYGIEMKKASLNEHEFPAGKAWTAD